MDNNGNGGRRVSERSLENLKLGAAARYQGKIRRNTTLLPETIAWLDAHGNASFLIDELVAAARAGRVSFSNYAHNEEINKLAQEIGQLREEVANHRRIAVEREADFERCLEQKISLQRELAELRSQQQESVTNSRLVDPVAIALIENAISTPKEGGIWNASKAGKAREQIAKALALLKKVG